MCYLCVPLSIDMWTTSWVSTWSDDPEYCLRILISEIPVVHMIPYRCLITKRWVCEVIIWSTGTSLGMQDVLSAAGTVVIAWAWPDPMSYRLKDWYRNHLATRISNRGLRTPHDPRQNVRHSGEDFGRHEWLLVVMSACVMPWHKTTTYQKHLFPIHRAVSLIQIHGIFDTCQNITQSVYQWIDWMDDSRVWTSLQSWCSRATASISCARICMVRYCDIDGWEATCPREDVPFIHMAYFERIVSISARASFRKQCHCISCSSDWVLIQYLSQILWDRFLAERIVAEIR